MEIETYINILKETLSKKMSVLQALLEATVRQARIIELEEFELEAFEANMEQKDMLLEQLEELDNGFDRVFQQIRNELTMQKMQYKSEILELQSRIRRCVDLGVEIQTKEERNRKRLETVFANQYKELRQVKTNSKTVSNYYKTMNSAQNVSSYFMDQKK